MSDIPGAVLSEHFQERMQKRRLVSAIFTTFCFQPSFFETEILPVFLDVSLSHAPAIKLVQLEDVLHSRVPGTIAVYYDQHGLVADGGSAKLDIRRFPILHPTGVFHPKNVLALVEDLEPDEDGHHRRTLLCSCASANLTRAGWWENVEVAHVEEIPEQGNTNIRDALIEFVDGLVRAVEGRPPNDDLRQTHGAAYHIREFLRGTTQRKHKSHGGVLHTHFQSNESVPEFIESIAGKSLRGMCLEIISPYFSEKPAPLEALQSRFAPTEIRVFLPRNDRNEAACSEGLHGWVQAQKHVHWGVLPSELMRLGKAEDIKLRSVHAKVYRFFEPKPGGREVLYVGSANLTDAGLKVAGKGGNWETGFLVEVTSNAKPQWWMASDSKPPSAFAPKGEDEGMATDGGTKLRLRYHWNTRMASGYWADSSSSPALAILHAGVRVFELPQLAPCTWTPLDPAQRDELERILRTSSLLEVSEGTGEPGLLLVEEEGMSHRPSLLLDLSPAEILRYWALLTVEQRAAFIESRARLPNGDDDPLLARLAPLTVETSLFDRFAGIFHAFNCLEDRAREAIESDNHREADYRLFGRKYDSLGTLLDRVLEEVRNEAGDPVEQYVITLCAKQLLRQLGREFPEYWKEHERDVRELRGRIDEALALRTRLGQADDTMPAFLEWFERWFLKRAKPVEAP
jgi:hypothetical protein